MKILRKFLTFFVIVAIAFIGLVYFSKVETRYSCEGVYKEIGSTTHTNSELYFELVEYRWWVNFVNSILDDEYRKNDGYIMAELPGFMTHRYPRIKKIGENTSIYDAYYDLAGHFYSLSKSISLKIVAGEFKGKCKKI